MGEIYRLDFPNGKSYIGLSAVTAAARFYGHKRRAEQGSTKGILYNAWRKYGEPTLVVLAIVENSELAATEIRAIAAFNTISPNGYNLSFGGDTSPVLNKEVRAKIKVSMEARWKDPEFQENRNLVSKIKQSSSMKARWKDPEYRAKTLPSRIKQWKDPEYRNKLLSQRNDPKNRVANSERLKALWQDPEYRSKQMAKKNNPEYRAAQSARAKLQMQDPEYKDNLLGKNNAMNRRECREKLKATLAKPEIKARQSAASTATGKNPISMAKKSASLKACWQDPEYRAKRKRQMALRRERAKA